MEVWYKHLYVFWRNDSVIMVPYAMQHLCKFAKLAAAFFCSVRISNLARNAYTTGPEP